MILVDEIGNRLNIVNPTLITTIKYVGYEKVFGKRNLYKFQFDVRIGNKTYTLQSQPEDLQYVTKELAVNVEQNSNILDERWIHDFMLKEEFTKDDNEKFTRMLFSLRHPSKDELKDLDTIRKNILNFTRLEDLVKTRNAIINNQDGEFTVFKIYF